jgi:hypothetical protein
MKVMNEDFKLNIKVFGAALKCHDVAEVAIAITYFITVFKSIIIIFYYFIKEEVNVFHFASFRFLAFVLNQNNPQKALHNSC